MVWLNKPKHFLAVDWSGRATPAGQRRHIVVASWCDGSLTLDSGYTHAEVGDLLLAAAAKTPDLVVGLDFAFSFPAWWLREQGYESAFALWRGAAEQGERWLSEGRPPFWGRPHQPRPADHHQPNWQGFRNTDKCVQAKSPFQIGGAGAVGTGSIRGMPMLARLHRAGFHIWPFQPPNLPLVLEIYPRLFTGPVIKSSQKARALYLRQHEALPANVRATAAASEDAFDALCSVLGMVEHAQHLNELNTHPQHPLEGAIWQPPQLPSHSQ